MTRSEAEKGKEKRKRSMDPSMTEKQRDVEKRRSDDLPLPCGRAAVLTVSFPAASRLLFSHSTAVAFT